MTNESKGGSFFFLPIGFEETAEVKIEHDRYEVYVNDDYVGQKVLLTPNEELSTVDYHLNESGFKDFLTRQEGDHYVIQVSDPSQAHKMRENLNIYLQVR